MRDINTDITATTEDKMTDVSLRPDTFSEYIGQEKVKENIKIYIDAVKARNEKSDEKETLDHVLFYGPPGLGKTTLSGIIAKEMGANIKITSGPAITIPGELVSILLSLNEGDVLFIDEIHRLNKQVEEVLYPAMEDFAVDVVYGKDAGAKSTRVKLPKFTLIGATTRAGLLSEPLRDRFGIINHLEYYTLDELALIVKRSAGVLNVAIDNDGALELARRSRGTPRLANRFLKRTRDIAEVMHDGTITKDVAVEALNRLDVDTIGLDINDRNMLLTIIERFSGGPVGLNHLAAALGEDAGTIEEVYEPYLVKNGLILRTPKGRVASRDAYDHFGIPYNEK